MRGEGRRRRLGRGADGPEREEASGGRGKKKPREAVGLRDREIGAEPGSGLREESKASCWGSGRTRAVDSEAEPSLAGKDSAGRGEEEEKTKARL